MALWYDCGNGLIKLEKSFAKWNLNADAYLCCPGPSLANVKDSDLHVPGAMVFGLNTSYPHIRPDIWIGMDVAECYNRNIWWEGFTKICRVTYHNMKLGNTHIKYCPNVYFADVEKCDLKDIFTRRAHDTKFIWAKNSYAVALHMMVWMGAKQINLVGCDFGGKSDYYDNRVLSDEHKKRNKKLYDQQINFTISFAKRAKSYGINVNSCTPNSPINEFVDYIDLKDALDKSQSKLPKINDDILYSTDAVICKWNDKIKYEKGIMVGCAPVHEDMIPWWIKKYSQTNNYPIAFADFGISNKYKDLCKQCGELIPVDNMPVEGWFRKPFAVLKAPFKKIIWCDLDIEVKRDMGELFDYSNDGKIGVGWDSHNPPNFRKNVHPDAKLWDSGLISVEHGNTLINSWASRIISQPKNKYHGDHEVLSIILWENGMPINEIPKTIHRMRIDPAANKVDNSNSITMHWTGPTGKMTIRDFIRKEMDKHDAM